MDPKTFLHNRMPRAAPCCDKYSGTPTPTLSRALTPTHTAHSHPLALRSHPHTRGALTPPPPHSRRSHAHTMHTCTPAVPSHTHTHTGRRCESTHLHTFTHIHTPVGTCVSNRCCLQVRTLAYQLGMSFHKLARHYLALRWGWGGHGGKGSRVCASVCLPMYGCDRMFVGVWGGEQQYIQYGISV